MKFTVLGASGFIGARLAVHINQLGHECFSPNRGDPTIFTEELGHAIYCIGLTADFRTRTFDTVRAHVCYLAEILEKSHFESLLYLSSTRLYGGSGSTDEEAVLRVNPQSPDDLYNLTKMAGESLCFSCGRQNVRVARLSNVYGPDFKSENFLSSILRDVLKHRHVALRSTPESAKDYVSIADVTEILARIAIGGRRHLYNVASGINVSNETLLQRLAELTGCTVAIVPGSPIVQFPKINTQRIQDEFSFAPRSVLEELDELVNSYRKGLYDQH